MPQRLAFIGRELHLAEIPQYAMLDLALMLEDVLVLVLAHGVVEEVLDARRQGCAEQLHLGQNLDAFDIEREGHFVFTSSMRLSVVVDMKGRGAQV